MKRILRYCLVSIMVASVMLPSPLSATDIVADEMDASDSNSSLDVSEGEQEKNVDIAEDRGIQQKAVNADTADTSVTKVLEEPIENEPPIVLPPTKLLISKLQTGGQSAANEFIELFNPTDELVELEGWYLEHISATGKTVRRLADLQATLPPQSYYILKHKTYMLDGTDADFKLIDTGGVFGQSGGSVRLMYNGTVVDLVGWGTATLVEAAAAKVDNQTTNLQRCVVSSGEMIDTDDNADDFKSYDSVLLRQSPGCQLPVEPEPTNNCQGVIISEIGANLSADKQFIELHNFTDKAINLHRCGVQTNRSATKSFVLPNITLAAKDYRAFFIRETGLTLTKTTSGIVYLLSSDMQEETDVRSYTELATGTTWAWFGGDDWRQTYNPTPAGQNVYQKYLPCVAGYKRSEETGRCRRVVTAVKLLACGAGKYRHPETNRCRNIASAKVTTPCRVDQYRNPTTNRCRNLVSLASVLKPCRANQARNPETNRCRNIASAASNLKPCSKDQKRNPETNRCRKVVSASVPAAAFAVEPIRDTGLAFTGWWALGGVTLLGAGYSAWEWRREVWQGIQKAGQFFTSMK